MTNGVSHPYHLDKSIIILGAPGVIIFISFFDEIHVSKLNSPRWDAALCGVPYAASYLGLFCLPVFHKKTPCLYGLMCCHPKIIEPRCEKTSFFAYAKTKTQISFAVTAKLIGAFVFAT